MQSNTLNNENLNEYEHIYDFISSKKFNMKMFQYYLSEYFEMEKNTEQNLGISENDSFIFANTYYHFIKLISLLYKDSEASYLINKVETISKKNPLEKMAETKKRKIFSNAIKPIALVNDDELHIDEKFMEIYLIIKFFEEITQTVEIKTEDKKVQRVIFTVLPSIKYLSEETKLEFITTVNRENEYTKLNGLMESVNLFKEEIEYKMRHKHTQVIKFLSKLNFYWLQVALYMIALIINIIILVTIEGDTSTRVSEGASSGHHRMLYHNEHFIENKDKAFFSSYLRNQKEYQSYYQINDNAISHKLDTDTFYKDIQKNKYFIDINNLNNRNFDGENYTYHGINKKSIIATYNNLSFLNISEGLHNTENFIESGIPTLQLIVTKDFRFEEYKDQKQNLDGNLYPDSYFRILNSGSTTVKSNKTNEEKLEIIKEKRAKIFDLVIQSIEKHEDYYYPLAVCLVGLSSFCIFIWCLVKLPMYYYIDKNKFKLKKNKKENELTFNDKFSIIMLESVFQRNHINTMIFILVVSIISISIPTEVISYTFMLLTLINLIPTLTNILIAIRMKYKELGMTYILTGIIIWAHIAIGFYFFNTDFALVVDDVLF